jgi:capsular polysaccharide transport system permease protein
MLLEIPTGIFFIALVFVGYGIGFNEPRAFPVYWPPVLGALGLLSMAAFGVGGSIAAILLRYEGVGWSLGFGVRIIAMTGGINFVPDYAPPAWQPIIYWNPMTHIVMLFRTGFAPTYPAHHLDVPYAITVLVCLILVSLLMERFMARKWVEASG